MESGTGISTSDASVPRNTLAPKKLPQPSGPRGYYTPGTRTITFTKGSDRSTWVHESAHRFLEIQRSLSRFDTGLARDLQTLERWFADSGVTEEVGKHELFASGFETYVMEGQAPTPALAPLFKTMRNWMLQVYKVLLRTTPFRANAFEDAGITPAVREVFDRMLASDAALAKAKEEFAADHARLPLYTLGLTERELAQYASLADEAERTAEEQVTTALMDDLQREHDKFFKAQVDQERENILADLEARPDYQARAYLAALGPEGKLPSRQVEEVLGRQKAKSLHAARVTAKDGQGDANMLAGMFGFSSGADLLLALGETQSKKARGEAATNAATVSVRERVGDPRLTGQLETIASHAVHNGARERVVARQIELINSKLSPQFALRGASNIRAEASAAAKRTIGEAMLADIRPHVHRAAEQRHGRAAFRAASKGDWLAARDALVRQLHQHYMWREAQNAREAAEKARQLAKSMRRGVRYERIKKAGDEALDALSGLLSVFDFRRQKAGAVKSFRLRAVADGMMDRAGSASVTWTGDYEDKAERAAIEAGRDDNAAPHGLLAGLTIDELISQGGRVPYTALTPNQIQEVADALTSLDTMAKNLDRLTAEDSRVRFNNAKTLLLDAIRSNAWQGKKPPQGGSRRRTTADWLREFRDESLTMTHIIRAMDGYQADGVAWNLLAKNLLLAGDTYAEQLNTESKRLGEIFTQHYGTRAQKRFNEVVYDDVLGRDVSKADMLSVALNWGTEKGRQRVLDGLDYSSGQVQHILDQLDDNDVEFINKVWQYLESFWEPSAQLHRDLYGFTPPREEAVPFFIGDTEMPGGYYPIAYDPRRSVQAEQHMLQRDEGTFAQRLDTRGKQGSMQARVETVKRPLLTDPLTVLQRHVDDTLKHTTHDRALYDVGRLLSDGDIAQAIKDSFGDHIYRMMTDRIRLIREGERAPRDFSTKVMQFLRNNATLAFLSYSARTATLQTFGLTNTVATLRRNGISGSRFFREYASIWATPARVKRAHRFAMDNSAFIRSRMQQQDVAIKRIRSRMNAQPAALDKIREVGMLPLQWNQYLTVDLPTWTAAYNHFVEQGKSEGKAVQLADQLTRTAQGGGSLMDMTESQADRNPYRQTLTNFLTYALTTYSLQSEETRRANFKSPVDLANFVMNSITIAIMPNVLMAMMNQWIAGEDDDRDFTERLMREQLSFMLSMHMWTSQFSGIAQGFDYTGPQGLSAIPAVSRFYKQAAQGEVDEAFVKAFLDVVGIPLGLPSVQLKRTYFGIEQAIEEDAGPVDLLKQAAFGPERR